MLHLYTEFYLHNIRDKRAQRRVLVPYVVFFTDMFCLFSWRYNPSWLYFHSPVAGFSLRVFEVF